MKVWRVFLTGAALFVSFSSPLAAQTRLTLSRVLELAASQNPDVLIARTREAQARGALTSASVRFASNPEVDLFVGPRSLTRTGNGLALDAELAAVQRFEIGGQRGFRMSAAEAGIDEQRARIAQAQLDARAFAIDAFLRAVYAKQTAELAQQAESIADEMRRAADARYEAGETAVLEVNVARVEQARAKRERLSTRILLERAYGDLREVLALPADLTLDVEGELPAASPPLVADLIAKAIQRPDLAALAAGAKQAESEWRLAQANRRPDVLAGVGFRREDTEPILGARIGISLPIFQRNTGAIATAAAHLQETQLALDAQRRAVETQVRSAYAQYVAAQEAAQALNEAGLPYLQENEQLAAESYRAGKISVVDLLVIRRESFAARREALDARLAVAQALAQLERAAGSSQ